MNQPKLDWVQASQVFMGFFGFSLLILGVVIHFLVKFW